MKRIYPIIASTALALAAVVASVPAISNAAVYTPPGPGSTNPKVQADGILVPDVFGFTPNWNLSPPLRKFVTSLAPLGCTTPNELGQCIPVAVPDKRTFPGSDYYEIELRKFTEKMHPDLPNATTLQGYVQVNNGTNAGGTANDVAPAPIHYLGPLIIAQKGTPVRIKFINKLPLESDLPSDQFKIAKKFFLPVDTSVMGAGMGAKNADGTDCNPVWDPRIGETKPTCATYTQNRAELHLHGGFSPWISDGTPHQWVTPAGEVTPYPKAVNAQYVPDMWFDATSGSVIAGCAGLTTCGTANATISPPGVVTYYYTNDQSARLMFYHDHSYGITRLNVYAGEAAGYMIQDPMELALINGGTIGGRTYAAGTIPAEQIPLVIQDKGFVDASTIATLDPTWVWGTGAKSTSTTADGASYITTTPVTGDLWWPHVYMPAENESELGGVNPMGRWVYGLYFWPPTTGIKFLTIPNPYYDCGPGGLCDAPWEPPTMPGMENPSWVAEAFLDTPMVNGTVFPKLDVQPKAYRFRILNAAHDRSFNLQLYTADTTVDPNDPNVNKANCDALHALNPIAGITGCATKTEVKMVPAVVYPGYPDWDAAADQREGGVPDPTTAGPDWIQIGSEGGFLPAPVVIKNKPVSWVLDPTMFNVGNVNDGTLIMAPAERADVIIDFSKYAGKTLILYNDAPAAFPAKVANNDYYTGAPDLSGSGGHPGPKAGIGPNTRTIMQINVAAAAPAAPFNLTALQDAFKTSTTAGVTTPGVFQASQHPVIVGQTAYDTAYQQTFPAIAPYWGISNIGDNRLSFHTYIENTLTNLGAQERVTGYPMYPKAIHDEMGAVYDEYGRMSAKLGVEVPLTNNLNQTFVMQNYIDPPTELLQDGKVQLWKITHNGVDTHPIHFHLFDVQVVNRVGWDGFVRLPWENELGWKETVRVSPLEDTIVALRPKAPPVPFPLPNSNRLLSVTTPSDAVRIAQGYPQAASMDGFTQLNPLDGQARLDVNIPYDFGAEYVWHCHILSHEEQDMMRPLVLRVATAPPATPTAISGVPAVQSNTISWTDNSAWTYNTNPTNDPLLPMPTYNTTIGFNIDRCVGDAAACPPGGGVFTPLAKMTMLANDIPTPGAPTPTTKVQSFTDTSISSGVTYTYRVTGYNRYSADGSSSLASWTDGFAAPIDFTVTSTAFSPATSVSLTPEFASPHGAPVKFAALGAGSTAAYQYRFSFDGNVVQDYSSTRFWAIPYDTALGSHTVSVDVRTDITSATPDATFGPVTYIIKSDGILVPGPGKTRPGLADALAALQMSAGTLPVTPTDLLHGDIAPLVNGVSAPDGRIDTRDALIMLRVLLGLTTL